MEPQPQSRPELGVLKVLVLVLLVMGLARAGLGVFVKGISVLLPSTDWRLFPSETASIMFPGAQAAGVRHVPLPQEVRGLYWTSQTAGSSRAEKLLDYAVRYGLNTVVIDLKADDGELAFMPHDPFLKPNVMNEPGIKDLDGLLQKLADKRMYRIARIFVMRDESYGVLHPNVALRDAKGNYWRDKTGSAWVDPTAPEVAQYAVSLAKEAYARGFDEVQFDYVRFPTDGVLSNIHYPVYGGKQTKTAAMAKFFGSVSGPLREAGIPVSFDVFGMVYLREDMAEIGQSLPSVFPLSDFISPMVYPSHYPDGFQGYANPADHPYEVVKYSLDEGAKMLLKEATSTKDSLVRRKARPWIQDFDIGAEYDASKIVAQIKAARDAGASGWLLWNARNVYTEANYR